MKFKIFTFVFSLFLSLGLFAQEQREYKINHPVGVSSISEAADIAEQIVKAAGLKANFMIAEANVPNALAVLQQGKRYVLYNPGFVNKLTRATGTKWAAVSILAHEIGHHLYNSLTGKANRTLATELEADKFSGYVLEKMGASLEEAQAAMNMLATPYATATHPAREDRVNSIASGWELAGGVVEHKTSNAQINRYESVRTDTEVLPSSSIIARLEFTNDPGKDYYITTRLNIVKIDNRQVSVLGRLSQSSDKNYPFVISDADGYRMYISSSGQIVSAKGHVIGKLRKA